MNVLILVAHPDQNSWVHAMANKKSEALKSLGHEVVIKDLYHEGFDPTLKLPELRSKEIHPEIEREQKEVSWADALIFCYPVWWFGMPAILKGWIDRVFTSGFAFEFVEGQVIGKLRPHRAYIHCSVGMNAEFFKKEGFLESILLPLREGSLRFCGVENIDTQVCYLPELKTEDDRKKYLDSLSEKMKEFMSE